MTGSSATGRVLIVGDDALASALASALDSEVRATHTAAATEGLGVDVVVVAGDYPFEEMTEVRVHPRLCERPIVLVVPGRVLPGNVWHAVDVWPVTTTGPDRVVEITRAVVVLLARARHPSNGRRAQPALAS